MTASVHEITAFLPHPLRNEPPEYQPMVTPIDPIERELFDYWDGCRGVRSGRRTLGSILFGVRYIAEQKLSRLAGHADLPRIRQRALRALQDSGAVDPSLMGPGGGRVA